MIDYDHALLSKVYDEGVLALVKALDFGIEAKHFIDLELAKVWELTVQFHDTHGQLPTAHVISDELGIDFEPDDYDEPLNYFLDKLVDQFTYGVVVDTIKRAKDKVREDPRTAVDALRDGLVHLEGASLLGHALAADLHEDWGTWWDEYMAQEFTGIRTGFPTIDLATGGYQPENLITIVGTPKAGKSTLQLQLAMFANVMMGLRVYFQTFEMSVEEQRLRLAAMIARTDYSKLLNRTLDPRETKRVRRVLERLEDAMPGFYMQGNISGGVTVPMLRRQIEKLPEMPHVVFVDGVYLMDSGVPDVHGMDPKALTSLTRDLKRLAQDLERPVVITHQVLESRYSKTKGIQSRAIGYSSSFAQDSNTILGVENVEDERQRKLSIVLARNAPPKSCLLEWDWATSTMEEIEEPDPDEYDGQPWDGDDDDD